MGVSTHIGASTHTGGIHKYGSIQMYGAYGHSLSVTMHAFFMLCMFMGHPNIIQTYRGCPNIWRCPNIQGVSKHKGTQTYRGYPNIQGVSKHMGTSEHTGGPKLMDGIQIYGGIQTYRGHPAKPVLLLGSIKHTNTTI